MIPFKIKIKVFAKRYHMGTLGGKGLSYVGDRIFFIFNSIILKNLWERSYLQFTRNGHFTSEVVNVGN